MLRALACSALFCCLSATALAQSSEEEALRQQLRERGWQIATLTEAEAAGPPRERARRLARDLRGVFSALEDGSVRHETSRRVCPASLDGWPLSELRVSESSSTRPERGDDVQCHYRHPGGGLPAYVTVNIQIASFPSVEQDLSFNVSGLQQLDPDWRGWSVNMAPARLARANVAMTRGSVIIRGAEPHIIASDIWITSFLSEPRIRRESGDVFWEVKVRAVGDAALRPRFDQMAETALSQIGMVVPAPVGEAPPLMGGTLRWISPDNPDSSALEQIDTGIRCPPSPVGGVRSSIEFADGVIRCVYSTPYGLWTLHGGRATRFPEPIDVARAFERSPQFQFRTELIEPTMIAGRRAAYLMGVMDAPQLSREQAMAFLTVSDNPIALSLTVNGADAERLPNRTELTSFLEQALPRRTP